MRSMSNGCGNGNSMGSQMNGGQGPSGLTICGVPLAGQHQCDPHDRWR